MLSIACLSQKGGVGKSTLARLFATMYAREGWSVKIADFNVKQTTSAEWAARRMAAGITPNVAAEAFSQLRQVVKHSTTIDLIVFDGKPDSDAVMLEIAKMATLIVIPVGVTVDDLMPQLRFAEELRSKGVEKRRIFFIVNKSVDSAVAINEARTYVEQAGYAVAETDVPMRTGYQVAQNAGRAICETTFASLNERAEALGQEVVTKLQSLTEDAQ